MPRFFSILFAMRLRQCWTVKGISETWPLLKELNPNLRERCGCSASGPHHNAAERYRAGRHRAPGWGAQIQSTKLWLFPQYFQFHHSSQMWEKMVTKRQAWKGDSGLYIHIHLQKAVKLILLNCRWKLEIGLLETEKGAALSRPCGEGSLWERSVPAGMDAPAGECLKWSCAQGSLLGPALWDIPGSSTVGGEHWEHTEQGWQQHQAERGSHTLDRRNAIQRHLERPQRWPCANLVKVQKNPVQGAAPGLGQGQAQVQAVGTCHLHLEGSCF